MSGKTFNGCPTYICSRSTMTSGMRRVRMVAWRVDKLVEDWVLQLASEVEPRAAAKEAGRAKRQRKAATSESLHRQLTKADERLTNLSLLLADGTLTRDAYRLAADKIEADRAALRQRLKLRRREPRRGSRARRPTRRPPGTLAASLPGPAGPHHLAAARQGDSLSRGAPRCSRAPRRAAASLGG